VISSIALIVFNIIMIVLIRKIITLRHYKIEWATQQNYLNDVNELLKRLRSQKHGFINHINVVYGLLTLKQYDEAKEYLAGIHETVTTKANVISIENPTLSALLNVKAKIAEGQDIRFEVNVTDDLSKLNFKAFEICDAIGNIINNAIEATSKLSIPSRMVKVSIYSEGNYYVFNIENTGKTIPKEIIDKIFEEGFTTKSFENGDHGFGLYITKSIVECYLGKIQVSSQNGLTSFKIYLPKVINNEIKIS
jgi:sensor histidine kinase regulating citrate/malate metabolism